MRGWKTLAVVAAVLGAAAGSARAADTWAVTPAHDVQSWIDQTAPGDTVQFLPGTYNQSIVLPHSLRLIGVGDSFTIILDGSGLEGPVLSASGSGLDVIVQGLTFRFSDEESVIDLGLQSSLTVTKCNFRAIPETALRMVGQTNSVTKCNFRGNLEDVRSIHGTLTLTSNRHSQTKERGVHSIGRLAASKNRFDGVTGVAITALDVGELFDETLHGGGFSTVDRTTIFRGRDGVLALGLDPVVSKLTTRGVSGQSCALLGVHGQVTGGDLRRTGVGVNVFGVMNTVSGNFIRGGTVGIFLVGVGNDALSNGISFTSVGIRVGEQWNYRGDQNDLLRASAHGEILGDIRFNVLQDLAGVGIAVEGTADVAVHNNILNRIGGRNLGELLNPLTGPGLNDGFAGALSVFESTGVTMHMNVIGEVDSGAGIAAGRVSGNEATNNLVVFTSASGIVFGEQDPFSDGFDGYGYYNYYGPFDTEGLGRQIYGRMNLITLLATELPEAYNEYMDEFEYGFDVFSDFRYYYEGVPGLGNHDENDYGYENRIAYNSLGDTATSRGAGIALFRQTGAMVASNYVLNSGGTGVLAYGVDYTDLEYNTVNGAEKDGIWLKAERRASGNSIRNNTVTNAGAEGIQNGADQGYGATGGFFEYIGVGYDYYYAYYENTPGIYESSYIDYTECVYYYESFCDQYAYIPGTYENGNYYYGGFESGYQYYENAYQAEYGYLENGTVISNNFVANSGIAAFANSGAVNTVESTGNFPVVSDWYAIPPRQY